MIELIQFPWSPFCLVQRRILEYSGGRFRVVNIPNTDRSLVWRVTRGRYYQVPVIRDGRTVVFETDEQSQVVAKYLDDRFGLGLFPRDQEGVQSILWRQIESEVEGYAFKLTDIFWTELVPRREHWAFVRHKERRFGRGCIEAWRQDKNRLLAGLAHSLLPFEEMLVSRAFLLDERPRFVDFDLYGMLANFLYTGHYELPAEHLRLQQWHARMSRISFRRTT